MSNSIKDLFNYDFVKTCSKCGVISSKSNFYRDKNRIDGFFPNVKLVKKLIAKYIMIKTEMNIIKTINYQIENREKYNIYQREYMKRRRETDLNFKLICNLRSRTSKTFKSQNIRKTNNTLN